MPIRPAPANFPAPSPDWLDTHAWTIMGYVAAEGHESIQVKPPSPRPWATAVARWLALAPVEEVVGSPDDPRFADRLATLGQWVHRRDTSADPEAQLPSLYQSWQNRPWTPQGQALDPDQATTLTRRIPGRLWLPLFQAGVSLDARVPTATGTQPLWAYLAPDFRTVWPTELPEAMNPCQWARTHHPEAWAAVRFGHMWHNLAQAHASVDTVRAALADADDQPAGLRHQWIHAPTRQGTPALWEAIYRAPRLVQYLHKEEAAHRKNDPALWPRSAWTARNAQGEDLWFAALRSSHVRGGALITTVIQKLKTRVVPHPDAAGRGWLVAHPEILANLLTPRTEKGLDQFHLRRVLRDMVAQAPELAFAGTVEQHTQLADTIWSAEPIRFGGTLIELAQWAAQVPSDWSGMTEPLRGLFIEALGYAASHPNSASSDGLSSRTHTLWTRSQQEAIGAHLDRFLTQGPWRVPTRMPDQTAPGALEAFTLQPEEGEWAVRRQAVMRQQHLAAVNVTPPSTARRRFRA